MMQAGVATVDITPQSGLFMSGYAARTQAATGAHDPLTVRALVINNTALVVCDVIGLHEDMSARIRHKASLPSQNIVLTAVHNHGAPASMPGRLSEPTSHSFVEKLEQACLDAIVLAQANARPCTLRSGYGIDPQVARNRRQHNGLVDSQLPVLCCVDEREKPFAVLLSYACHPVVLGADNRLYTADYPHYVRTHLESRLPGCTALFCLGAAADSNSGHTASASITTEAQTDRTFTKARQLGEHIADCALQADLVASGGDSIVLSHQTMLDFQRREKYTNDELISQWTSQLATASAGRAALLKSWINWAQQAPSCGDAPDELPPWHARVSLIEWGQTKLYALPGEQFASVAHIVRAWTEASRNQNHPVFVLSCAEGNPGYICPDEELVAGGYEPDEAHRYYGMPSSFAPGSVDRLLTALQRIATQA